MKAYQAEINNLVALANRQEVSEIPNSIIRLCEYGAEARLAAVAESFRIESAFDQHNVVAQLVRGESARSGLQGEVLRLLADSDRPECWALLAEIPQVFEKGVRYAGVPRKDFKDAYIAAWRKASGATKQNLEETLKRRGFKKLFGIWL